ncbi:MAG: DinB family protein [Boseongicola sp.]
MSTIDNPWLRMALNNAWANATLYAALNNLPDSAFTAERPGFFSSLAKTMNHIYEVDLYYLDALEGGGAGRSVYDRADNDNAAELAALQSAADMRFAQFCNDITTETLEASRLTVRPSGNSEENVAALILHLVQHQIHHRGQAHVQLSDAGVSPPQMDDFYLEHGRVPSAQAYW